MNKRLFFILSSFLSLLMLCSCMNSIPELSEDEEVMVVRYMADSVLEHDINYKDRLLSDEDVEKALIEEQKKAEQLKKIQEEEQKKKEEQAKENVPDTIETKDVEKVYVDSDISDYIETDDIVFSYKGYHFSNRLPENDNELAFVVAPSSDEDTLLVIDFDLCNNTDGNVSFLMSKDIKMKAIINDKKRVSPMVTFLDEDLNCNIEKQIPAGGTYHAILVFEIPKEEEIEKLGLSVTYPGKDKINIGL